MGTGAGTARFHLLQRGPDGRTLAYMAVKSVEFAGTCLILEGLPPRERRWLDRQLERVTIEGGMVVAQTGDPAPGPWFLGDAAVSLRAKGASGAEVEVAIAGPGQLASALACLGGATPLAIVAIRAGTALRLPGFDPVRLPRRTPVLAARISALAAREAALLGKAVWRYAAGTARQRLATHLADVWMATGERLLAASHDSLAALLGLRRATITIALQELEQVHAVRARRGLVEIVDPVRLEAEALV